MAATGPELQQLLARAQAHHRAGELGLAESHYLRAAKLDPRSADIRHALGVVAYQRGHVDKAIRHYREALERRPRAASVLNNLALALRAKGDLQGATEAFEQALAVRPEYAEAAFNLALLHEQAGDFVAAERAYRQALTWRSDWAELNTNLGNLLRRLARPDEADRHLTAAAVAEPAQAAAQGNLALLRIDQGRYAEARALAHTASRLDPHDPRWREAAGIAARLAQDADGAVAILREAKALAELSVDLLLELGQAEEACGDIEAAAATYAAARRRAPALARARWHAALALPAIPRSTDESEAAVQAFARGLETLHETLDLSTPHRLDEAFDAVRSIVPYRLHYLAGDHTALQARFGDLVARVAQAALPEFREPVARRADAARARWRIGFVSECWREHVVARFFVSWLEALDVERFEIHIWHTGETTDARTEAIAARAARFAHWRGTLPDLARAVRAVDLDVLIYPDLGLDPRQQVLAALHLAPVQCAGWGHPVTSGLASIDYFLAADAFEPADAQRHYRERLLRLPGLGAVPWRPPVPATDVPAEFAALRGTQPLILCAQNLMKLPPSFDGVLARLAAESGARLVFFDRSAGLSARFRARLGAALAQAGVDADAALAILPVQPYPDFLACLRAADALIDSPNFSGGATSLDALALGVPVVTQEGVMARGRQTAGMLRRVGLPEVVAASDDDFVTLASRLARDAAYRAALGGALGERAGTLFEPAVMAGSLGALLERLARSEP